MNQVMLPAAAKTKERIETMIQGKVAVVCITIPSTVMVLANISGSVANCFEFFRKSRVVSGIPGHQTRSFPVVPNRNL